MKFLFITFVLISFLFTAPSTVSAQEKESSTAEKSEPLGPPGPDQPESLEKAPPDFQADKQTIAQQDMFPEYMKWPMIYASDMVYTPLRSPEGVEHVADNISVLTYDDIMKLPARDIDEAIGFIPGVVVQQAGNIGQPAQVFIGGGRDRQVRVIFDDMTFNTVTEGTVDLAQFPIEAVGKVEVVKGPSSSTWGSSLSGVINMFTKPVGTSLIPHGEATYGWGEFHTDRRYFDVAQKIGPMGYFLSGSLNDSGGFRSNSDVHEKRIYTKTEIDVIDGLKLKGSFGYFGQRNSEFDDPVALVRLKREVITKFARMGFQATPSDKINIDFATKFVDRHFTNDSLDLFPDTFLLPVDMTTGTSFLGEISLKTDVEISEKDFLTLGSDIDRDMASGRRETFGIQGFNVRKGAYAQGYYGNYRHYFKYLDLILGSRFDNNNAFGHQYSPSAGAVVHLPFIRSRWKFNFQRAFNAPPLTARFFSSTFPFPFVANPGIRAERDTAYSIAWAFNPLAWVGLEVTGYQNFVTDGIEFGQALGQPAGTRQFINVARERRDGIDGEFNLKVFKWVDFLYAINYVKVTDRSQASRVIRDRVPLSQDLGVTVNLPFNVFWTLRGKWVQTNRDPALAIAADRVFIFDSKLFWRWPKIVYGNLNTYLQITNMFNSDFSFDRNFNPNPPRQFEFGLRYEF